MEDGAIESETIARPPKIEPREREENEEFEDEEKEREKRQKVEDKVSGGIFDNIISKLAHHSSNKPTNNVDDLEDTPLQGVSDSGSGSGSDNGGVINNFISNLFHRSSGEGEEDENVKSNGSEERLECRSNDEEINKGDHENGGGKSNGGSILSNLVPDVVDPAPDEASILIHSVVHD